MIDQATGLPLTICCKCGCEVVGWVDEDKFNPSKDYICDDCKEKYKEDDEE